MFPTPATTFWYVAQAPWVTNVAFSAEEPYREAPEARKPAWRLWIDFGPAIGVRKSSAQITENHPLETLVGQQVAAVVNFPPRQIGPVVSEVLTLGFPDADGKVVLVQPGKPVPNGGRLF